MTPTTATGEQSVVQAHTDDWPYFNVDIDDNGNSTPTDIRVCDWSNSWGVKGLTQVAVLTRTHYESLVAERDRLRGALTELRQAVWNARAILGFDNGGDPTPDAMSFPTLAELVVRDAAEFRADYDAAIAKESTNGT